MRRPLFFRNPAGMGPVLRILGILLLVLALFMLIPLALLAIEGDAQLLSFVWAFLITFASGALLLLLTWGMLIELRPRQMFILTTSSWVVLSAFSSLPMQMGLPSLTLADAVFESVSAITTTGSTVLVGIDDLSDGFKLWRGLMQWIGGVGIIVMAIAVLPFLRVGGMRLFQTESSDWSDKVLPRAGTVAKAIGMVYVGFTLVCIASYWLAGMMPLDAVVHGMTSVATGGFANYDASFGHYADQPLILWLGVVAMLTGALPFVLYIRMVRERSGALWQDQQVRGLLALLTVVIVLLSVHRAFQGEAFFHALTDVAFNVVSVVTTTGYASDDYAGWGSLSAVAFFYLMFIGGCSGSTSGGMKVFRFQIGLIMLVNQLRHLVHANGVFVQRYNGRVLTDDQIRGVIAFSFFFFFTVAVLALGLSALGLDLITALSGAVTAVANVGPGIGEVIGPAGNFAPLPDAAKWMLSVGMLMGRLEILTVLVLLTPTFWRK